MTEAQTALTELIESSIGDEIEAIGDPVEEDGLILVDFQYGETVFSCSISVENGTMSY